MSIKNIVSQKIMTDFVKKFNNEKKTPTVSQVLATVREVNTDNNGKTFVEVTIDNSDNNTPAVSTLSDSTLKIGDRVLVQVSDRQATVVGNISNPQQQRVYFYPNDDEIVLSSSPDWKSLELPNLALTSNGMLVRLGEYVMATFTKSGMTLVDTGTSITSSSIILSNFFKMILLKNGSRNIGTQLSPVDYPNTYMKFEEDTITFNAGNAINFTSNNVKGLFESLEFTKVTSDLIKIGDDTSVNTSFYNDIFKRAISISGYKLNRDENSPSKLCRANITLMELDRVNGKVDLRIGNNNYKQNDLWVTIEIEVVSFKQ